jgi:D-arabinose 5-phosphate isomerase GutQ
MDNSEILERSREMIRAEGEAVIAMADLLGEPFLEAVRMVAACSGVVMTTGSGTSGTIARRLAHMLATTGMHAGFVHPADALHGPSASVQEGDILIAYSKAGKSAEINHFVQVTKQRGGRVISLTWEPESELGKLSDITLAVRSGERAEGEGVLPYGSTLAAGAVSDALCQMVKLLRGFDLATLAQTHPSGATAELVRKK